MSLALVSGALTGMGCIGVLYGLRCRPASLEAVAAAMNRPFEATSRPQGDEGISVRSGRALAARIDTARSMTDARRARLAPVLAITGQSVERLIARMLILGGAGLLAPPVLWVVSQLAGVSIPVEVPILIALIAVTAGLVLPIIEMVNQADERRRHFRSRDRFVRGPGRSEPGWRRRRRRCPVRRLPGE